jgi:outer membrane protein assembly factor BamB
MKSWQTILRFLICCLSIGTVSAYSEENWPQFKYDCRHSGNVPNRSVSTPLGLVGAVPLTDAIFTAPVVEAGYIYVVDGSGVAFCLDAETLRVVWKFASRGGKANCSNVSSPAIAGDYLHFGTMAGSYYVLDTASGALVKEIACGEPIFSAPVVTNNRVYFATLGSRVYCLKQDGTVNWDWDFVKEHLGFTGDRWSGEDWLKHKGERVSWQDQFLCSRDLAVDEKMIVLPAGSTVAWLEDAGSKAVLRGVHQQSRRATFGLTLDKSGAVYWQWVQKDNWGSLEILRLRDGKVEMENVKGTLSGKAIPSLLSFCSVSLRGQDVYRCHPEENFALCKFSSVQEKREYLGGYPSIASPILLRDNAVYGGLDGSLYVVPLSGSGKAWSFKTAFGKSITAPAAVCNGRIYFGCDDGYLYVLGPGGKAKLPMKDLQLWKIRSPLTGKFTDSKYDRFTSFSDFANTNVNDQDLTLPLKVKWTRRYEGTTKHFSTCGGGRMYTHTAEGQIFAVEQETGRLLWRVYNPGVHISYTTALYYDGRLLVPQAGLKKCRLRCLDAATGKQLWEAPFAGSPSWARQLPPIVYNNLVIYMFGTGQYRTDPDDEEKYRWLRGIQYTPSYTKDHKPMLKAWDLNTGREVWSRDFSMFGSGGDEAGICLMDNTIYYSCFFGFNAIIRKGLWGPEGITAAIDPVTGQIIWSTTKYYVHSGCTISGKDGRLYLGGYNPVGFIGELKYTRGGGSMTEEGTGKKLYTKVWCIDAKDGSFIWESDPLLGAANVTTIDDKFLFTHAQYRNGYLLDKETGKILKVVSKGYKCTRFNLSKPYLLGTNMDVIDLSDIDNIQLISTGPPLDIAGCIGPVVSNGRMFYTSAGAGMQACQVYGMQAASITSLWKNTLYEATAP